MRKFLNSRTIVVSAIVLIAFFSSFLIINSCRKIDQSTDVNNIKKENVRTNFFKMSASVDPIVRSIAQSIKLQDEKRDFIPRLIKKAGFAIWDKAKLLRKNVNASESVVTETNQSQTVIIPFVLEDENTTNAGLVVSISSVDTTFTLLFGSMYSQFGFTQTAGSWNAKDVFHMFTKFDKEIFNHTAFKIKDKRLLNLPSGTDTSRNFIAKFRNTQGGVTPDVLVPETECDIYDVCYEPEEGLYEVLCESVCTENCTLWVRWEEMCTTTWVETGGGGSGGGSGGGGGGGSGGGGNWEETLCIDDTNTPEDECNTGWNPLPSPTPYVPLANQFEDWSISTEDATKIIFWKNNNVDSSGLDSCRKQLLNKLISSLGTSPMGIFLSKLDKALGIPNGIDKFNLHFITRPLANHNAFTEHATYDNVSHEFEADIVLDSATSKNATDIFIATNLIHEITHAYMLFIYKKLNAGATPQQMSALGYDQVFNAYVDTLRIRDSLNPRLLLLETEAVQHNYMADHLLDFIAGVVKQFDNNSNTPDRYYWYLAWAGLTRKQVQTWKSHWPNYPTWPPANPAPVDDSTRGLKYALTQSRIDSIFNKVLDNEEKSLPGAKGKKPVAGGCY